MPEASVFPRVSIVTPSFRRAGFIETCLASVCAQEYPNLEHIVIDGGSDDGTLDILRRYEDRYDVRWVSASDRGMYHAIEKGLSMARGDILAWLNTDDAYLPWSVCAAVEGLTAGAAVVFGDLVVVRRLGGRDTGYVQFYPPFTLRHYLWSQTLAQPTVFWTRRAMEAAGSLDLSYGLIGDCEYWLRLAASGFVPRKIEEVLAAQVDHPQTLRQRNAWQLAAEFARLRAQYRPEAGPPPHRLAVRLKRGCRWRRDTLRLTAAYVGGVGSPWRRFTRFLHERRIPFHPSYAFVGLLPGRLRFGAGASLLDGARLLDAIAGRRQPGEAP